MAIPFAMPVAAQQPGGQPPPQVPGQQPPVNIEADPEELFETFGLLVALQSGVADLDMSEEEFEWFSQGMKRAFEGEGVPENLNELVPQIQAFLGERQETVVADRSRKNRAEAEEFFSELEGREGIQQTEEGLFYQIEEPGVGESPEQTDTVRIHYEGRLTDGTVFDSSRQRGEPAEMQLSGVVDGMAIGLTKLREGGKGTLYIPPDLGYGDQSPPSIPAGSALIFEVELIEVVEGAEQGFSPETVPQLPQQ